MQGMNHCVFPQTCDERWEIAVSLLGHPLGIGLGLLGSHRRSESPDHVVVPASGSHGSDFVRSEAERHPQFALIQMSADERKFETAGHHADDLVRLAV